MSIAKPFAVIMGASALALGACATSVENSRVAERDALEADCEQRGGMLIARPGGETSEVRASYYCRLDDGTPTR